jgi:tRNA-dihydrouridine synthase
MTILTLLDQGNIVGLSPMDGVTDLAFRQLLTEISKPDLVFTEFVSAEGLSRGGLKLFDHLIFTPEQRPVIGQLFGKDPDGFYQSALVLCFLGFDGIDINMGCPAKTVVQHGGGAALIGKPDLAINIIKAVQSAVADFTSGKIKLNQLKLNQKTLGIIGCNLKVSESLPSSRGDGPTCVGPEGFRPTVSVKTRLGLSQSVIETWIPHLLQYGLDFITLHGRTLKEAYSGLADWNQIKLASDLAKNSQTKIIGNGDIQNRQQGIEYCQKYGVSGVLIGRASLGNPWVFNNYLPTPQDRFSTAAKHYQLFQQFFPKRSTDSLRRHLLAYASGLPHAKQLRSRLVHVSTLADLLSLENNFLNV